MVTFKFFSSSSDRSEPEPPLIWMCNGAVLPSVPLIEGRHSSDSDDETSCSDMPTLIADGEDIDEDEVDEGHQHWLDCWHAQDMERQQRQEATQQTGNVASLEMYNINADERSSSPVSVVRETETSARGALVHGAFVRDDGGFGSVGGIASLHPPPTRCTRMPVLCWNL